MDDKIFDQIHDVDLKKTMETSYIDYAMSVIAQRALPDVRDGLKPVQRRVLYSMIELNNGPDKPHRKCARIVGDTMGKYHPHGDSSIYGALVNMAQDWSTRYPLVDGHGNFGSVDGDGAAAMRLVSSKANVPAQKSDTLPLLPVQSAMPHQTQDAIGFFLLLYSIMFPLYHNRICCDFQRIRSIFYVKNITRNSESICIAVLHQNGISCRTGCEI